MRDLSYDSDPTLTRTERTIVQDGLCVEQTGYGLPGMTFCGRPRESRYYCKEHAVWPR